MRILLSTYGSRGDVEPMAALGVQLRALGAEVAVCAPPDEEFAALLDRAGVPLKPAFSSVRQWVTKALADRTSVDLPTRAAEIVAAQFSAISEAAKGCDLILAAGLFPSTAAARSVAERMGIPYIYATFCPIWLPSIHHRPQAYPGHPLPPEVTDNRLLWELNVETMNAVFGTGFNAHRASIGLPVVDNVRDHVFTARPWLASDPALSPWQQTKLSDVVQTGAWILPDERPLAGDLLAFLDAGPAPVYVGFGSMPMQAARDAALAAIAAIRVRGHRAIVLRGWADLVLNDEGDDCFIVGDVNQQALFARVAAVVHHGGAGTTTTAARAGAPQLVVPQIADQPYWAGRVVELGIGVAHDGQVPTVASLSAALGQALPPDICARAANVARTIRSDGAALAARLVLEAAGQGCLAEQGHFPAPA
ncbi:glycosyltransferase [Mesorhizobium sp. B2-3-4]|uniref:glycosyltransferase n=1 Tax=Mesorhizobium sp. B2-3-4 TaxID=2589959 RepID=UPI00112C4137|nr:glycosyltransferase [Mesorhizobium sp. B2-3-4]TPM27017.1 glycosyltransferase family 1 protein [Mesorhizobium sp. B2-3-4]